MPKSSDGPEKQNRKPITSDLSARSAPKGDNPVPGVRGVSFRVYATKKGVLTRRWIWRAPNKERSPRTIGHFPAVRLAEVKRKAVEFDREFAEGIDPGVRAKRRADAAVAARSLTLSKAIDGYVANAASKFKNPKSEEIRKRALRASFAPLHPLDVTLITAADVAGILRSLAPQVAIKSHSAIRAVFDYAATTLEPHRIIIINPADPRRLRSVGWSPKPQSESTPHPSVHWKLMPEVVAELAHANDVASACALFIIATTVRAGTARLAKWSDIDLEKSTWTPPLGDLKDGKHHRRPFIVPLNSVALDALKAMRGRSSRYVFGGPIADDDITSLIRRLRRRHDDWLDPDNGKPFTIHGFRASFRTWVEDVRPSDDKLAELSLGHKVHGEVAARYIRTGLVEERRALLDAYACHLCGQPAVDNVIPIRSTR